MRYFIVRYAKQPNGQMDESVSVSKRLRMNDMQMAAVILDFKTGRVEKASLNGVTVPRDFVRIRDYYRQHYKRLIEDLEAVYGHFEIAEPSGTTDATPDKVQESN